MEGAHSPRAQYCRAAGGRRRRRRCRPPPAGLEAPGRAQGRNIGGLGRAALGCSGGKQCCSFTPGAASFGAAHWAPTAAINNWLGCGVEKGSATQAARHPDLTAGLETRRDPNTMVCCRHKTTRAVSRRHTTHQQRSPAPPSTTHTNSRSAGHGQEEGRGRGSRAASHTLDWQGGQPCPWWEVSSDLASVDLI